MVSLGRRGLPRVAARESYRPISIGLRRASAVIVWTTLALSSRVFAQPQTFYLCESNVAEVSTSRSGQRFLVTVRLTEVGTEHWAAFTTEHVARQVRVHAGSVLLIEAQVQTPITSGLLEIARPDSVSAEDVRQVVEGAPETPCGADPSG